MKRVVVTGSFDNLLSRHVRFLEEAAKSGDVQVLLWSDEAARELEGKPPQFSARERQYVLQAIRFVRDVTLIERPVEPGTLPGITEFAPNVWVVEEASNNAGKRAFCEAHGMEYRVVTNEALKNFPLAPANPRAETAPRKKVMVTGCFDWFHSGHVRFFEEVSTLGELYVVVGHDANVRLLKGEGHPLFPQEERRYMVQSVRHVKRALISSGHGWMDAEPEVDIINPDFYVVNEDGDKPEKRAFCKARGIEYVVLKRVPREGLPPRQSTDLRGF